MLRRFVGRRIALKPSNMPQLVWLSDPSRPASARPVRPEHLATDIAPDVRLHGAWLEITRDQITTTLGNRLPWLVAFVTPQGSIGAPPGVYRLYWNSLSQGASP